MTEGMRRRGLRGGALKADLELLEQRAEMHSLNLGGENTEIAYSGQWSRYLEWCTVNALDAFEHGPEVVCLYLAYLTDVRDYAPATLRQVLSALRNRYRQNMGDENPTKHPVVSRTIKSCCRENARKRDRKWPLRAKELVRIVERMERLADVPPRKWTRDKAVLLVGWAGAYRRSELTSLKWADVKFMGNGAARIFLCHSKTDQLRHGHWSEIGAGANETTCPVAALKGWRAYFDKAGEVDEQSEYVEPCEYVFRTLRRGGGITNASMDDPTVNAIVKGYVEKIGLDAGLFGGHSLRAGWITDANEAGMPVGEIMKHSRHRSMETMQSYNRPHESFVGALCKEVGL